MDFYLDSVMFSKLPIETVQELLILFFQNTQPQKLKYDPKVVEYSDTKVMYTIKLHYIRISVSVDILLKNLNGGLNPFFEELITIQENQDTYHLEIGNAYYTDCEILNIEFFTIIIRVDSILRLMPGGTKEFVGLMGITGRTNGRLFIISEMRDHCFETEKIFKDILQPYSFERMKDYVYGYSCQYDRKDYWKPIEWCLVPWLKSVITPFGNYLKFLAQK